MAPPRCLRPLAAALILALAFLLPSVSRAAESDPVGAEWQALRREADGLGKPEWHGVLRYLANLHERGTHPPAPPFADEWESVGPGYGYGPAFGNWDIANIMLDEFPTCPVHVRHQLTNDIRLQLDNGFLPGLVYMPGSPSAPGGVAKKIDEPAFDRATQSHPPLWVVAADAFLTQTGDATLRQECLERLERQIRWFEQNRRAPHGGFFYNDILIHKWESGVDDGVRFDSIAQGPKACVDATAHVYWLYHYAEKWARETGRDGARWKIAGEVLGTFIRTKLWDEQSGFFYDSWAIEDPKTRTQAFEGMWPVVVGAATPAQAKRVIDEWLLNPKRLRSPHPIATVGLEDPHHSLRMWRGPVWNSMTYWAARACVDYGRPEAARALLEAALDDTAAQFARTGTLWEYFHPLAGRPEDLARKPYSQRNQPWTDYVGHNPLFAMARLWEATAPGKAAPATTPAP